MADKGVDFTDKTLTGAELKAAGLQFCCRYLSGLSWKDLTPAEAKEKSAAGIKIVSNWEVDGNPANTVLKGQSDARAADRLHRYCGGRADAPIYFSIDKDVPVGSKDNYFRGIVSVLGLARVGVYGSSGLVRHLLAVKLAKYGWRTMSVGWSGGAVTTGCALVQTKGGRVAGTSVDFDSALVADYGGWMVAETPKPPVPPVPTPTPEDEVIDYNKVAYVVAHSPQFTPVDGKYTESLSAVVDKLLKEHEELKAQLEALNNPLFPPPASSV